MHSLFEVVPKISLGSGENLVDFGRAISSTVFRNLGKAHTINHYQSHSAKISFLKNAIKSKFWGVLGGQIFKIFSKFSKIFEKQPARSFMVYFIEILQNLTI